MGKCFICGSEAQSQLDSGEWICRDCVEGIGGYKHWFEIKVMPPEQITYMLDGNKAREVKHPLTGKPQNLREYMDNMAEGIRNPPRQRNKVIVEYRKRHGCLMAFAWFILILSIFFIVAMVIGGDKFNSSASGAVKEVTTTVSAPRSKETSIDSLVSQSDRKLLKSLGLSEIHVMDVTSTNEKYKFIRARIFDSENMQLNITLENEKIITVVLTGIMPTSEVWSNRTDKLTLNNIWNGSSSVTMYADTEGGKMAVLDWGNKRLSVSKNSKY